MNVFEGVKYEIITCLFIHIEQCIVLQQVNNFLKIS
jgi:hypothetical protein